MAITPEVYNQVMERDHYKCRVCGRPKFYDNPLEVHHCLIHRVGGKHPRPEFDVAENLETAHKIKCHPSANSRAHRKVFWKEQCAIYSTAHMDNWYKGLNLKSPEYF